MSSAYQIHVVFLQKSGDDIRSERERYTSIVFTPASDILVRIRPQEIAEKTAIRNLNLSVEVLAMLTQENTTFSWRGTYISRTHDATDLLHGVEIRTQTTVHREDLLINNSCDWQAIEAIGERLPKLDVVSSFTLVVESIDTVNRSTFMVTTEDEEILGVFDLVCEEKANGFKRLLSSVDVIS